MAGECSALDEKFEASVKMIDRKGRVIRAASSMSRVRQGISYTDIQKEKSCLSRHAGLYGVAESKSGV